MQDHDVREGIRVKATKVVDDGLPKGTRSEQTTKLAAVTPTTISNGRRMETGDLRDTRSAETDSIAKQLKLMVYLRD